METLHDILWAMRLQDLTPRLKLLGLKPKKVNKGCVIDTLKREYSEDGLRRIWASLTELQQAAVAEAVYRVVLEGLLDEVPEAVEWVWERDLLKNANAKRLVTAVRNDLAGCEPFQDLRDRWVEGEPVDYDRICERLKVLLESGHTEEVVDLAADLLRAGGHELEHSHENDWDIQYGVGECLKVVFEALKRSKRSPVEQILWEIGMEMEDDYGLLGDREAFQIDREPILAETWSEVADRLMDCLANMGKSDIRRRRKIVHQIILSLRRSERVEELFTFLREETGRSDCVLELGVQLCLYGRVEEAVSYPDWMGVGRDSNPRRSGGARAARIGVGDAVVNLVLDPCAVLYLSADDGKVTDSTRDAVAAAVRMFVSAVTAAELACLQERGYRVLRFLAEDLGGELNHVLEEVLRAL